VLFLASFLIFVNTQSVVLSDPILVSIFVVIVIAFFFWRIVHNMNVARRHVKSISKDVSNLEPSTNKSNRAIYIEFIVFLGGFEIASWTFNISGPNMATMTNTFATISGVLLGLYFLITTAAAKRDDNVTILLLFSILTSLFSSLYSFDPTSVQNGYSKLIFGISAAVFVGSTVYFIIGTEFLGPLRTKSAASTQ